MLFFQQRIGEGISHRNPPLIQFLNHHIHNRSGYFIEAYSAPIPDAIRKRPVCCRNFEIIVEPLGKSLHKISKHNV